MSEAPRRSSRLKTTKPVAPVELDSADDNEDGCLTSEASEHDTRRARKYRRTSTSKRGEQVPQKKRGRLAELPNMPIDILCEVGSLDVSSLL
jgi:hypothetical protein